MVASMQRANGTYTVAPNSSGLGTIEASISRRRGTTPTKTRFLAGADKPSESSSTCVLAASVGCLALCWFLFEVSTTAPSSSIVYHRTEEGKPLHRVGGPPKRPEVFLRRHSQSPVMTKIINDNDKATSEAETLTRAMDRMSQMATPPPLPKEIVERLGGDYPYSLDLVDESYDIRNSYEVLGGFRFPEYTTGQSPYKISNETKARSDTVARSRRHHVKAAMQFAWDGYAKHAMGMDELRPVSGTGHNPWGGRAVTLIDALDTLWLMDLKDEFWHARDWVRDHLDYGSSDSEPVSLFETTIRDLGGLLAAYDWSGDPVFLDKATDLGERLLRAFDGSKNGLPPVRVSLQDESGQSYLHHPAVLAEFGTLQIEFRYLARAAGRPELASHVERVFAILNDVAPANGLYAIRYSSPQTDGAPEVLENKVSFGAMGDSFFEYMLKVWLQGGKTEPMYRDMYDKSMEGMHNELLQRSTPSALTYIPDMINGNLDLKMDHLACFMGGLLALGAYTDPLGLDSARAQRDLQTAKALTYTCYQMYARMATGISAEFVRFNAGADFTAPWDNSHYLLRPEAVESFFILNQLTGDPVYREWGWEVFQSIEKYCKTEFGYGAISNVQATNGETRDSMESFFLAETLKYLYLLNDPDTEIDLLRKHVFNTEAHPLRFFSLDE